jgi:hypothetical protein
VRRVFDHVSLAYCDWESAAAILDSYPACKRAAIAAFGNDAKNDAIVEIARRINFVGFAAFKESVVLSPIQTLTSLPYIGNVTAWHLAKNLGLNVAKPDRHLIRVSERLGFRDAGSFCESLGRMVGEKTNVVDLIIWRYLADNPPLRAHWC